MITLHYPKLTKARKAHKCDFCLQEIEKGSEFWKSTHKNDGKAYDFKTHQRCSEIADILKMGEGCDDGVTSDFFIDAIKEEYINLMSKTNDFVMPKFQERLNFVCDYYQIQL